jgi:uncharacterized membrane protein YeaQ/YmgE (transglycosylase-associated protein family)
MGVGSIFAMLIVGAIAGWLAGKLVKGHGFGLSGNIVVGALLAGFIFPRLGLGPAGGTFTAIIHATIGAVILLVLIRVVKRV